MKGGSFGKDSKPLTINFFTLWHVKCQVRNGGPQLRDRRCDDMPPDMGYGTLQGAVAHLRGLCQVTTEEWLKDAKLGKADETRRNLT